MKVYVAGSSVELGPVQAIIRMVQRAGHTVVLDWTTAEGKIITPDTGEHWSEHKQEADRISSAEIEAARTADVTIIVHPATVPGRGCWIEMGAALGAGKQVWIVDAVDDTSVFFYHHNVRQIDVGDLWDEMFPSKAKQMRKGPYGIGPSEATS